MCYRRSRRIATLDSLAHRLFSSFGEMMGIPTLYEHLALTFLRDGDPRDRRALSGIGEKTLHRLLALG
jgi:hypothetical protein